MPDLGQLQSLDLSQIVDIIQNPTSNLTAAALIGAAVILILLILVAIAWMLLLTVEERSGSSAPSSPESKAAPSRPRKRQAPPKWLFYASLLIAVGILVGLTASTGRDSHCLGCHQDSSRPEEIEAQHATCVDCHESPSFAFFLPNVLARVRMQLEGQSPDEVRFGTIEAIVGNASCLSCHKLASIDQDARASAETSGSVGVVMSHSEPIEAGMRCTECHGSVGAHVHVDADGGHPTMRTCIDCHDGQTASSDCAVCHIADATQAVRANPTPVAKTRLDKPRDCSGCHGVEECDACHGIRLPHSEEFVDGGHGYEAAFGRRKSACSWCHQGTWCLEQCHPGGNWQDPNAIWGHPTDWVTRHAQFESKDCIQCHSKRFTCESCHLE